MKFIKTHKNQNVNWLQRILIIVAFVTSYSSNILYYKE